jgi:TetR/AcrR family transcriptional repressor of nem operon
VRNPELTKDTILKKSGALFNTQGYKATSLSQITLATGLTKGAIYRHFGSKEALEKESLSHLSFLLFDKISPLIRQAPTAGKKLNALFNFFESYISKPPLKGGCPLLNAAIEADDSNPLLRREALKILKILRDSVKKILVNGIKYKQIKPSIDLEFHATVIIASLEGAIMMSKLNRNNRDIKHIIRHLEHHIQQIEV